MDHLNLAVLAYWLVSVTKYRLKLNDHENIRWDEIMRIAKTQVMVTARVQTEDGEFLSVRQSTEAEEKLSAIYSLLDINPHPMGKIKSVVHLKILKKNHLLKIRKLSEINLQCGLKQFAQHGRTALGCKSRTSPDSGNR